MARPKWRVVARPLNEFGDVVYDVYRGSERKAWGLTDEATAKRWLSRLAAAARRGDGLEFGPVNDGETDEADAEGTDGETELAPRRVWWND